MITIVFDRNKLSEETAESSSLVVHAYPACQAKKTSGTDEYYLEDYGTQAEGLKKITMAEIVSSMASIKRVELL